MYTPCQGYMFIYKELFVYIYVCALSRVYIYIQRAISFITVAVSNCPRFWTARVCVACVRFPCSTPIRDRISVAPPMLFSGYTSSRPLSRRVFGEQRGGAAEILSWIGVGQGNEHKLHILEWD